MASATYNTHLLHEACSWTIAFVGIRMTLPRPAEPCEERAPPVGDLLVRSVAGRDLVELLFFDADRRGDVCAGHPRFQGLIMAGKSAPRREYGVASAT